MFHALPEKIYNVASPSCFHDNFGNPNLSHSNTTWKPGRETRLHEKTLRYRPDAKVSALTASAEASCELLLLPYTIQVEQITGSNLYQSI